MREELAVVAVAVAGVVAAAVDVDVFGYYAIPALPKRIPSWRIAQRDFDREVYHRYEKRRGTRRQR